MSNTRYRFYSTMRQGFAASIATRPEAGRQRVEVGITLKVERRRKGSHDWDPKDIAQTKQLMGPGDKNSIDDGLVVRTDPKHDSGNFEPNYFPMIEFADPDFTS